LNIVLILGIMDSRAAYRNEERANAAIATLERNLDVYDKILSTQKYLAGDVSFEWRLLPLYSDAFVQDVTLADLFHLPYGEVLIRTLGLGEVIDKRPNLSRCVSLHFFVRYQTCSRSVFEDGGKTFRLDRLGLLRKMASPPRARQKFIESKL
jgi:hypothetical protein